jgi:hypothetical protein
MDDLNKPLLKAMDDLRHYCAIALAVSPDSTIWTLSEKPDVLDAITPTIEDQVAEWSQGLGLSVSDEISAIAYDPLISEAPYESFQFQSWVGAGSCLQDECEKAVTEEANNGVR